MPDVFCTSCGKPILTGTLFCENCGARVAPMETPGTSSSGLVRHIDYFSSGHGAELNIRRYAWKAIGLIYTDSSALRSVYGERAGAMLDSIKRHIEASAKRGILYFLLDSADNRIEVVEEGGLEEYVGLLARAVENLKKRLVDAQAVFIIGGHDVVPMGVFANPADDSDGEVETDLPYSTLNPADPADDDSASLAGNILVGRLPLGPEDDPVDLDNYFQNVSSAFQGAFQLDKTFGLSAKEWEGASKAVYRDISRNELLLSPSVTLDNIDKYLRKDAAIHYFNLHGSDETEFLYGQQESSYPEAFSPKEVVRLDSLNIIGNEACYGARYIDLEKSESILLSALSTRTVAMVASTRIAFGPPDAPPHLADVAVGDFIRGMKTGQYAGEALAMAKRKVLEDPELDQAGVKTVLEFNLFGDPLLLIATSHRTILVPIPRLEVHVPDIRVELLSEMDKVNEKIRKALDARVRKRYPEFSEKTPLAAKIFMGKTRRTYTRFTFNEQVEKIKKILVIYMDDQANITKEYLSK